MSEPLSLMFAWALWKLLERESGREGVSAAQFVYAAHAAEVTRAAALVLGEIALAEDVAQEVFLALWRGGGYDECRGPLGPYLRMVARSRALDLWRQNRASERTRAGSNRPRP